MEVEINSNEDKRGVLVTLQKTSSLLDKMEDD